MKIGIIGEGAIGRYVRDKLDGRGHDLRAVLLRPERLSNRTSEPEGPLYVSTAADLPDDIEHMIDCAGHRALRRYGPDILRRGTDLTTLSIGALADPDLYQGDNTALIDLQRQHGHIERDLAAAEEAWLALQEEWEAAALD